MKTPARTFLWSVASLLMLSSTANADQTSHVYGLHDRTPTQFAFTGAKVYVDSNKILNNATLVINNGVIESVKENGKIPKGVKAIDLSGKTIYPGFIDPYTHYTFDTKKNQSSYRSKPKYQGDRTGGNAWNEAIHAQVDWVDNFSPKPKEAEPYIKNGFTAVQTAKHDGIFRGQAVTVSTDKGITSDVIYRANASHFGSFDKGSSKQSYPSSLMGSIALIRQTLSDANWYRSSQGKVDKLFTGQPVEFNAGLEGINELNSSMMIFDAGDYLSVIRADKLFDQYKINTAFLAEGKEYQRISEIKKVNSPFILPLNFPAKPDVTSFESQLDVSLAELRHWERAPSLAGVFEKNNIEFAFTHHKLKKKSDFWPNIKTAIKHGLSEKSALKALTETPAKLAGISSVSGKLLPGMRADLVITNGNVFDDGEILSVWHQGKEHAIQPLNSHSFTGSYIVNISSKKLTLELQSNKNKTTGKFLLGELNQKITVSESTKNIIRFHADLSQFELPGVYRFSAELVDNQLTGSILSPTLEKQSFATLKTMNKDDKDSEKQGKGNDSEPQSYVGKLTIPNRAFGLLQPIKQQNVHIKNATIWTSNKQQVLTETDILVRKGKFYKIGKNLKTPSNYQVIDATGKHVTAGIIDEHSHIAISKGVNEGTDAITAEVNIGDVVNPDDINIYRALAGGVTAAQLLHGSANPIGGQAQVIKLKWGASSEELKEKRAPGSIKFALGENVKQSNWGDNFRQRYPQSRMGVETIVRDAFIRAEEYKAAWEQYDDLSSKEKKRIAPPRRNFRFDTLVEILEQKRFVHSHSYVASEILSLMKIAEDFDFTIQTFTHILEGYKVADEMAKHGASASTFADWWAYKFEVYDAIPMNTCLMMEAGVNVSVNSDSSDLIRRLNTEAAKSIQYCDMTPEKAWDMVTINPAKQLKIDAFTGSIEKGKDADFVIWTDNPLSIYARVEQTWIEGRKYFDRALDEEQRDILKNEKALLIAKALKGKQSNGKNGNGKNGNGNAFNSNEYHDTYLLKDDITWHCEDQFDVWHFLNHKGEH